jgi:hypothetical protein
MDEWVELAMVCNAVFRNGVFLAAVVLLATPAIALELKPGLWELRGKVARDGRATARPAQSRCISARAARASRSDSSFIEDLGALRALKTRLGEDACKLAESTNSETLLNWRYVCKGSIMIEQVGNVRMEGPERLEMIVTTRMTTGDKWLSSTSTTVGHYKGECRK